MLESILTYNNLIVILAVIAIIEAIKETLRIFKVFNKKLSQAALPYLPLLLGVCSGLIPGVIEGDSLGFRLFVGLACGGLSGQIWKIFKNQLDLLKDKLDEKGKKDDAN